jgi:hypothetical protein
MDPTQYAEAVAVIIGLVNGVDMVMNMEWNSFAKYMMALIAGLVFGFIHWFNIPSPEIGLAIAIGSSGVYKLFLGNKTPTPPTPPVTEV